MPVMVGESDGSASCDGRNDSKTVNNKGLDDSVLLVTHVDVGAASGKFAEELSEAPIRGGDLLISIDGTPIRSLRQAEEAVQGREKVSVRLVRDGSTVDATCHTQSLDGRGTRSVIGWAGLLLQVRASTVE